MINARNVMAALAVLAVSGISQAIHAQTLRSWTGLGGDSHFMNSHNWSPEAQPGPGDSIVIASGSVVLDGSDLGASIYSLDLGGSLDVSSVSLVISHTMDVTGSMTVHSSAFLSIGGDVSISGTLQAIGSPTVSCGASWIPVSLSSFLPGSSTVEFLGSGLLKGRFYDLSVVDSAAMGSAGNITVQDNLSLQSNLALDPADSLILQNSSSSSFSGAGRIEEGTIARAIDPLSTDRYRFGSDSSYVRFPGLGTGPTLVTITPHPYANFPNCGEVWETIPSTVDTVTNTVRADSVTHFTRWQISVPRPVAACPPDSPCAPTGYTDVNSSGSTGVTPSTLALQYNQAQLPPGTDEDSLSLMRSTSLTMKIPAITGWNLLSLPLKTTVCNSKSYLFSSAISSAFIYAGTYAIRDTLSNRRGFWLKFGSPQNVPTVGLARPTDTIPVVPGWNMIGTFSSPVPASVINSSPPGLLESPFFGYDGAYVIPAALAPGRGYWIKISSPGGKLFVDTGAVALPRPTAQRFYDELADLSRLIIADGDGHEQTLFVGAPAHGRPAGSYELPPVPPPGSFDARFTSGSYVASLSPGQEESVEILSPGPVTLIWHPVDGRTAVTVRSGGGEAALEPSGPVRLETVDGKLSLRLLYGAASRTPREFSLDQNYPNPFNPSTTIRFSVSRPAFVVLRIFDMLGREVGKVVNEVLPAGSYSRSWNAPALPSGVYFYRLQATPVGDPVHAFSQVRSMILLK